MLTRVSGPDPLGMTSEPEFHWPEGVKRAITNRDVTTTGTELLKMGVGFRALPADPKSKAPLGWLTPHGVSDATDDPVVLQQWMALAGDAALGIVPGDCFAIVDDDIGQNCVLDEIGLQGTFSERTRRGIHAWGFLPPGRPLRKSRLSQNRGDLITGDRAYVVVSPSPGYEPIDIEAPILTLPDDSPLWLHADKRRSEWPSRRLVIGADDMRAAKTVMGQLLHGPYSDTVRLIVEGRWRERYPSRSEADFALAVMASHFLRDYHRRAEVLAALLFSHSEKAREHASPHTYVAHTVENAIDAREQEDRDRLQRIVETFITPHWQRMRGSNAEDVYDPNLLTKPQRSSLIRRVLAEFAEFHGPDEYTRPEGWRRLPVTDFADVFGVSGEAIRKHLVALERDGTIERHCLKIKQPGGFRADSLVRSTHVLNRCERSFLENP